MKVVILDNYDSFTYNLYQYLGELGVRATVVRNDRVSLADLQALRPERLVISPGPGDPQDRAYFGVCREAILSLGRRVPLLGVCLGHQGIVHAYGGRIVSAPEVMHGKTSLIRHDGSALFAGLPPTLEVMRYHSLVADVPTLPACLQPTAWTDDGLLMAIEHRELPVYGVQFHPESIGTPLGKEILRNFLALR